MSSLNPFYEPESDFGEISPLIPVENFQPKQNLSDGSTIFEISDPNQEESPIEEGDRDFYDNLAHYINSSKLIGLAARLLDEIKQDKESRSDWEKTIQLALKYLGFKIDEFRNVPFFQACSAYDSTLSTALLHFYSIARAELLPAMGPARSEVIGSPTPEVEDQGDRVKIFLNYFLTQIDEDYYPDFERLLIYVGLFGCAFKKVYQDPILNRPTARLVKPQDFIINHNTTSILTSSRMTEVMFLDRKEIILRQHSGDFIEMELPAISEENRDDDSPIQQGLKRIDGIEKDAHENKTLFKFYECHVELEVDDIEPKKKKEKKTKRDIPRPYVVTICDTTKKIMSIKRNWKEGDDKFKRLKYFVHYYYLPGFGIYSIGLAHLIGSNSIVLTSILRQLIDAGTLKNFPGGLKKKEFKAENNDMANGPSEFRDIETGGQRLQDGIMLMPYGEPSQVLAALRTELKQESSTLVSTLEQALPEIGSNTPVGTTMAMLEISNKLQSSVLRSLHASLGQELKLLFSLFGEYLPEESYPFSVPGRDVAIMKKDFNDRVNIVPVSDPNVLTSAHRLIRNEALLKLANSAPQIHDIREAYHRMYTSMNIENIDKLLPAPPKPEAQDPVTENMNLLMGRPITVAMFQDDESHIISHKRFASDPQVQANPAVLAETTIHIQRHEANKAYKEMHMEKIKNQLEQNSQAQLMQVQQQSHQEAMMLIAQGVPAHIAQQQSMQKVMLAQQQAQKQIEQQMSQVQIPQLSPEEEEKIPLIPEIQNRLAAQNAQEVMQEIQEQAKQQQEAEANQLDPNKVMIADIEQRREAAYLKDEESKLKAETEAFKAQLKYEAEMAKTDSQREIASEKHEVDLAIEERKNHATQFVE